MSCHRQQCRKFPRFPVFPSHSFQQIHRPKENKLSFLLNHGCVVYHFKCDHCDYVSMSDILRDTWMYLRIQEHRYSAIGTIPWYLGIREQLSIGTSSCYCLLSRFISIIIISTCGEFNQVNEGLTTETSVNLVIFLHVVKVSLYTLVNMVQYQ